MGNNIPTAEEFALTVSIRIEDEKEHESLSKKFIEFAKLHVEAALKAASEKATTKEDVAIFAEGTYRTQIIDKDSILNAYLLTNIK
jgi:hypothetical protein